MTATIINVYDPMGICKRDVNTVPAGSRLLDFLIRDFGPDGFAVPTILYSGCVEDDNEIILEDHLQDGYIIEENETIIICQCPLGLDPFTIFIIAAVVSIAIVSLTPTPEIPEFKSPVESPNNNLTGQTNIARPLQRIPDLFGQNIVFPDIIAKTYFEFIANVKNQVEYLCIGRGEYLVEELKSGETIIDTIPNSFTTVFPPFTRPAELLNVTESNEVDGQELIGPNVEIVNIGSADTSFFTTNTFQSTLTAFSDFELMTAGQKFDITSPTIVEITGSNDISFAEFFPNQITTIAGTFNQIKVGDIIQITDTASNNGSAKVVTVSSGVLTCVDSLADNTPKVFVNELNTNADLTTEIINAGTYTFVEVSSSTFDNKTTTIVTVLETTFTTLAAHPNQITSPTAFRKNEIGPFRVPGNPDQVWIDIQLPKGCQNNGSFQSVDILIRLQEVNASGLPVAPAEDKIITITEDTIDPLFFTFKFIPLNPGALYNASVTRKSDTTLDDPAIVDQTKWTRMAGVEDVTVSDFGNVTTILINTKATEQATSIQERKFNAKVTRKLRTFENGALTVTKTPTTKAMDALLEIATDSFMGNKPSSQLDLVGWYDLQDSLDNDPIYGDTLGRFCYSFSNARVPVGDEMRTVTNAIRGFRFQEGHTIKVIRDQVQPFRGNLFNRRNKKPNSESKSRMYFKPGDFDAISLEWTSEDDGEGNTVVFPEDGSGTNFKKIEAAGIKNYNQAWNRASYEFQRLIHSRTNVSIVASKQALILNPNLRVANVDGTNIKTQDGEIRGINGLIIATSELVDFTSQDNPTVILTGESGQVSEAIQVTPRADTIGGFVLESLPSFDIFSRGSLDGNQIGTLYSFSGDNNHLANDYLVQDITPGDDGYVNLKLINYSVEIYQADTQTPTEV